MESRGERANRRKWNTEKMSNKLGFGSWQPWLQEKGLKMCGPKVAASERQCFWRGLEREKRDCIPWIWGGVGKEINKRRKLKNLLNKIGWLYQCQRYHCDTCTLGFQDAPIKGNYKKSTRDSCIISYNFMWVFNYLKLKSYILKKNSIFTTVKIGKMKLYCLEIYV